MGNVSNASALLGSSSSLLGLALKSEDESLLSWHELGAGLW